MTATPPAPFTLPAPVGAVLARLPAYPGSLLLVTAINLALAKQLPDDVKAILHGKRISIRHTRAMLNAALEGKLHDVEFTTDPVFGFQVPKTCPGVPEHVLDPAASWPNRDLYMQRYRQLAARFIDNFKKFGSAEARELEKAGPKQIWAG